MQLPKGWRFRVSWRGKLILQRYEGWNDDGRDCGKWVDAGVENLMVGFNKESE